MTLKGKVGVPVMGQVIELPSRRKSSPTAVNGKVRPPYPSSEPGDPHPRVPVSRRGRAAAGGGGLWNALRRPRPDAAAPDVSARPARERGYSASVGADRPQGRAPLRPPPQERRPVHAPDPGTRAARPETAPPRLAGLPVPLHLRARRPHDRQQRPKIGYPSRGPGQV